MIEVGEARHSMPFSWSTPPSDLRVLVYLAPSLERGDVASGSGCSARSASRSSPVIDRCRSAQVDLARRIVDRGLVVAGSTDCRRAGCAATGPNRS